MRLTLNRQDEILMHDFIYDEKGNFQTGIYASVTDRCLIVTFDTEQDYKSFKEILEELRK